MIYQKYLSYTRLQAAFYAREFTLQMISKTQKRSIELYNYAEYLYDLNERLAKREKENNDEIEERKTNNKKKEDKLKDVALKYLSDDQWNKKESWSEDTKEKAVLAIKFYFDQLHSKKENT